MDQDIKTTATETIEGSRTFNASKLGELLELLDIKEAYYIDDYNKIDPLPIVVAATKKLYQEQRNEDILKIFSDGIETNVPDEDAMGEQVYKKWAEIGEEEKKKMMDGVMGFEDLGFNTLDYTRTRELKESFPDKYLQAISPDEWDDTFKQLENKYATEGKVLLLFDQDLNNAQEERFKNGTIKGQHLILNVKKSSIKDNVYCALITHLITDTSKELGERNTIIKSLEGLTEKDFFALAKDRIKTPDLLCDGIKKTLLNGYCEEIKERSKKIIEDARENALKRILELDTYDFDHTILRSSYSEGVWEMNTFFRIAQNIFSDEVKDLMGKSNYAKNVNPFIKKAKAISDVRFNIDPQTVPYKQKFSLRHQDIYEKGDVINKLHLPLENGDVFQVIQGTGKGYYILVGQECDLMMRTNPLGTRTTKTATLLKLKTYTRENLTELITNFYEKVRFDSHFFSNKFKLDYFTNETNDIGLIKFGDSNIINLDVLDLCVFDINGEAKLDLAVSVDKDLLSSSWEYRYEKVVDKFKKTADSLDKLTPELDKLSSDAKAQLKKKAIIRLGYIDDLGRSEYASRKFDFGIKRVMRLKSDGAKYLLDRYYKHESRTAEQHDFAFEEKVIKEGLKAIHEDVQTDDKPSPAVKLKDQTLEELPPEPH